MEASFDLGKPGGLQSAAMAARRLTRILQLLQSGSARDIISSEYSNCVVIRNANQKGCCSPV